MVQIKSWLYFLVLFFPYSIVFLFLPKIISLFFLFFLFWNHQFLLNFGDPRKRKLCHQENKIAYRSLVRLVFCTYFFFISPWKRVKRETSLYSASGFWNVSKFTRDLILFAKFLNSMLWEPFLMPLCFLLVFWFLKTLKYSLGLTTRVTQQDLSILSIS